jgi:hypothetical protein
MDSQAGNEDFKHTHSPALLLLPLELLLLEDALPTDFAAAAVVCARKAAWHSLLRSMSWNMPSSFAV